MFPLPDAIQKLKDFLRTEDDGQSFSPTSTHLLATTNWSSIPTS